MEMLPDVQAELCTTRVSNHRAASRFFTILPDSQFQGWPGRELADGKSRNDRLRGQVFLRSQLLGTLCLGRQQINAALGEFRWAMYIGGTWRGVIERHLLWRQIPAFGDQLALGHQDHRAAQRYLWG